MPKNLIEIWGYVALHYETAADRLLDRFDRRWELLTTQPYSGAARPDIGEDVRYLVVGEYLSFYRVERDRIVVLRVLHGHRDITSDDVG